MYVDEGDPFNEILLNKSLNQIKSRGIFKNVNTEIVNGSTPQKKIIDIFVEEKPTGEIMAGAGTGTTGSSFTAGIKENNYLGKGIRLDANFTISDNALTGVISTFNPNFNNSDRSLNTAFENSSNDYLTSFGYKTNKTGFTFGTSYEQFKDIIFSPSISSYYEVLDTSSKAPATRKKQEGDYFDSSFTYGLTLNRLNQNYQPTDGYRTAFIQSIPIVSDDVALENAITLSKYHQVKDNLILSTQFYLKNINSISDKDVRISKRLFAPQRKLRGFEPGKVGPKDGSEHIGGNYVATLNLISTLPGLFPQLQDIDFSLFLDSANVWGVDYDSSLDSSKIRSSTGIAIEWYTPIGPLSFSFAQPITKASTDKEQTFRFDIGTSF